MNIEYISFDNGSEAVHVTAKVTEDKVTKIIKGSFNSLPAEELPGWFREQFYAPTPEEIPAEKVEGIEPVAVAYTPDPARVAKVLALEAEYKKAPKIVEIAAEAVGIEGEALK